MWSNGNYIILSFKNKTQISLSFEEDLLKRENRRIFRSQNPNHQTISKLSCVHLTKPRKSKLGQSCACVTVCDNLDV